MCREIEVWLKDFFDNGSIFIDSSINEIIGGLHIFNKKTQIKKIEKEIMKFSKLLNKGYPFVYYNFKGKEFNRLNFVNIAVQEVFNFMYEDESFYEKVIKLDYDKEHDNLILERFKEITTPVENNSLKEYLENNSIGQDLQIEYNRSLILEALLKKKDELIGVKLSEKKNSNIKFNITQTEFTELIKALIQNNNVIGKQKDILDEFSSFFGIKINNPNKLIQDIKNRNTGSETLFIDKLKATLFDYITKENTR